MKPYDTEHGTVNPDHALALYAWHVSHSCSTTHYCSNAPQAHKNNACFYFTPQLDGLLRDSANGSPVDLEKLVALAMTFDDNPGPTFARSAFGNVDGLTTRKFLRVLKKRATEHPPGNPRGLLLAEQGVTDPTCVDTNNPLCLTSLLRESVNIATDVDDRFEFTDVIRSDLGCPDLFCEFSQLGNRHHAKPGPKAILPTSTHWFDDSSRLALQRLQSTPLPFGDFCKFMLFVLTDGMRSANDHRRLHTNAHRVVHTGMWLCFGSWLMANSDELLMRLDSVRTTHIDFLGDDLLHELLVRHLVLPMHNPRPRPHSMRRTGNTRYGEEACQAIELHSPHEGQKVTIQTLQMGDFECHPKFLSHARHIYETPDEWMILDSRFRTAETRAEMRTKAFELLKQLHHPPTAYGSDAPDAPDATDTPMRPFIASATLDLMKDEAFGMRYRRSWIRVTNRQLGHMRLVCRAWDDALRPFCLRPAFANFLGDYSETAADVRGSSAMHGMMPLNVHLLERGTWSQIYVGRRYAYVHPSGDIKYKLQSFPPNLLFGESLNVTLRLGAVDGDTPHSRAITCLHVPQISTKAKYMIAGNPNNRLVRLTVPAPGQIHFKFTESHHRRTSQCYEPIVSGMFLVDRRAMLHAKWMPATTSRGFRRVTGMPLTPLRLIAHFGEECGGKRDYVAMSSPFYVLSRKAKQSCVDEAAQKRRKVQLHSVAEEREGEVVCRDRGR